MRWSIRRARQFSVETSGLESAPPKWPGNSFQGTSVMWRMTAAVFCSSERGIEVLLLRAAPRNSSRSTLYQDRFSKGGLLVRGRWELPRSGRRWANFRVDVNVEEAWLGEFHGVLERACEIVLTGNGQSLHATGSRESGEVGIVRLLRLCSIESRPDLAATVQPVLEVTDRGPGEVVPDHPNTGEVVLDRRGEDVRRHHEASVSHHRHAGLLRSGELRPEDAADAEAHRRVSPGVEHGLRPVRGPELHEPVVMHALVEADNGVVRQHRPDVSDDALGMQRRGLDLKIRTDKALPLLFPGRNLVMPFEEGRPRRAIGSGQLLQQLLQEGLGIRDDSQRDRVIAAELRMVDVHLHELRRREVP